MCFQKYQSLNDMKLRRLCFYTCLSFCSRGSIPASLAAGGGACARGVYAPGGLPAPGGCGDPPLEADGYCCGRYASYWNAFLFMYAVISDVYV